MLLLIRFMRSCMLFSGLLIPLSLFAQKITPDIMKTEEWKAHNRSVFAVDHETNEPYIRFDARRGDGLYVYQNLEFENGILEFDVKGKNVSGRSFVGIAFHILDNETFNAIYFRPFNFKNPERDSHSVQYICHPQFTWSKLRESFPGKFENRVKPVPNPEEYFHAKIVVKWPMVTVFVDYAKEPSLEVKMKSSQRKGKIGFWTGNGSDGFFKNLVVHEQ